MQYQVADIIKKDMWPNPLNFQQCKHILFEKKNYIGDLLMIL